MQLTQFWRITFGLILVSYISCQFAVLAKPKKAAVPSKPVQQAKPAQPIQGNNLSPQYNAYIEQLRTKIGNNWILPDGKNVVTISASLAPDGSISDLSVTSVPSNTLAEQAASDAFNQSQPFPSLPTNSPNGKITVTFESTADPHGDSSSKLSARFAPNKAAQAENAPAGETQKANP